MPMLYCDNPRCRIQIDWLKCHTYQKKSFCTTNCKEQYLVIKLGEQAKYRERERYDQHNLL